MGFARPDVLSIIYQFNHAKNNRADYLVSRRKYTVLSCNFVDHNYII